MVRRRSSGRDKYAASSFDVMGQGAPKRGGQGSHIGKHDEVVTRRLRIGNAIDTHRLEVKCGFSRGSQRCSKIQGRARIVRFVDKEDFARVGALHRKETGVVSGEGTR